MIPKFALLILNDNCHSLQHVMEVIYRVCRHDIPVCMALANQIHDHGKAMVWAGHFEACEFKATQILKSGPDSYNGCDDDLDCEISPLPEGV